MNSYAARLTRGFAPSGPNFENMFMAACVDLGLVNEALGLDPNDGGAEPIIDAIQDLTDEIARLKGEAGVLRRLLMKARDVIEVVINDNDMEPDEGYKMAQLSDAIAGALQIPPAVQFLPADDTEGGSI